MLVLLIVLVVALALIAVVVFMVSITRRRGAPGDAESPEVAGTYYGDAVPSDRHPTRDYIGEEPRDLKADPQAEAELWKEEREHYREKNEPS